MNSSRKRVARSLGVAMFAGMAALGIPAVAQAAPSGPVGILGGCADDEFWRCGKVANSSGISVRVTTDWGDPSGNDFMLASGDSAGGHGVDIDGFYVGDCGLYTDYGYLPANSGWWKVANYTYIDIYGSWC